MTGLLPAAEAATDVFSISDDVLADRLEFIQEIGYGNWGSVWMCRPKDQSTKIAVKLVHRSKTSTTAARVRSLWNEMKVVRALNNDQHPSLIPFYSFIITPSYALITMPYHPRLVPVEVPEHMSKPWFRSLLSAIHHLHTRGIVHNDIKPANILLSHDNVPVLVDFGFAERYDTASTSDAFHSNLSYGTPEYLSPERARGLPHDTRKSDIWSLGITFFEILVGRTPFENTEEEHFTSKTDLEQYWSRTLSGNWVGEWEDKVSKGVERVLRRMVCPNADLRCTAEAVMKDRYWEETHVKATNVLRRVPTITVYEDDEAKENVPALSKSTTTKPTISEASTPRTMASASPSSNRLSRLCTQSQSRLSLKKKTEKEKEKEKGEKERKRQSLFATFVPRPSVAALRAKVSSSRLSSFASVSSARVSTRENVGAKEREIPVLGLKDKESRRLRDHSAARENPSASAKGRHSREHVPVRATVFQSSGATNANANAHIIKDSSAKKQRALADMNVLASTMNGTRRREKKENISRGAPVAEKEKEREEREKKARKSRVLKENANSNTNSPRSHSNSYSQSYSHSISLTRSNSNSRSYSTHKSGISTRMVFAKERSIEDLCTRTTTSIDTEIDNNEGTHDDSDNEKQEEVGKGYSFSFGTEATRGSVRDRMREWERERERIRELARMWEGSEEEGESEDQTEEQEDEEESEVVGESNESVVSERSTQEDDSEHDMETTEMKFFMPTTTMMTKYEKGKQEERLEDIEDVFVASPSPSPRHSLVRQRTHERQTELERERSECERIQAAEACYPVYTYSGRGSARSIPHINTNILNSSNNVCTTPPTDRSFSFSFVTADVERTPPPTAALECGFPLAPLSPLVEEPTAESALAALEAVERSLVRQEERERSVGGSGLSLLGRGLKKSLDMTRRIYKSSTNPLSRSSAHVLCDEDDAEVEAAAAAVAAIEEADAAANQNQVDRMTLWIRDVEKVVEDARQNFAANSVLGPAPLPTLPVGPTRRSVSENRERVDKSWNHTEREKRERCRENDMEKEKGGYNNTIKSKDRNPSRRSSRAPRRILAANQIFVNEYSSGTVNANNNSSSLTPSSYSGHGATGSSYVFPSTASPSLESPLISSAAHEASFNFSAFGGRRSADAGTSIGIGMTAMGINTLPDTYMATDVDMDVNQMNTTVFNLNDTVPSIPYEGPSCVLFTVPPRTPEKARRRATIMSKSPVSSMKRQAEGRPSLELDVDACAVFPSSPSGAKRREKSKSQNDLSHLGRAITPVTQLEFELERLSQPQPTITPRLSMMVDKSMFITNPSLLRRPLIDGAQLREEQDHSLSGSLVHVEPYPPRPPSKLFVALDTPGKKHVEGVYDRFLMSTTGVKRLGKGYQSDNAPGYPPPASTSNTTSSKASTSTKRSTGLGLFNSNRKAMPPPVSSEDLQRASSFDEFGNVALPAKEATASGSGTPKEEGTSIVKRFKAMVGARR